MDAGAFGFAVLALTQDKGDLGNDAKAAGDELASTMRSSRCWSSALLIQRLHDPEQSNFNEELTQCFGNAWRHASSKSGERSRPGGVTLMWDANVLGEEKQRLIGNDVSSLALRLKPLGLHVGFWLASYAPDPLSLENGNATSELKDLLNEINAARDDKEPILLATSVAESKLDILKGESFVLAQRGQCIGDTADAANTASIWIGGATEQLSCCFINSPVFPSCSDSVMFDIRLVSAQPKVDYRAGYLGSNFMWRGRVEQGVMDLLLNDFEFTSSFQALKEHMKDPSTAFRDNCNPFHPKGHFYFEADYHGLATPGNVDAMPVARQYYHLDTWKKKPLPKITRAFFKSFHELNKPFLSQLFQTAPGNMDYMKTFVEEDRFFSCVSAQFRCGNAVPIKAPEAWLLLPEGEERKTNKYGWHMDWSPSIFHMAISLRGTRIVHAMIDGRTDEGKPQSAGDVYIGCPGFFDHAVEFPEMGENTPVLSLQARTLLPSRTAFADFDNHDFQSLRTHICSSLLGGELSFVLPTTQQVMKAAQQIEDSDAEKPAKVARVS